MNSLRQNLKRLTPQPLWRAARDSWLALKHGLAWPNATLHPLRRQSIARLAALTDAHRSQRAFILGNGPSLRKTDVSKLERESTFGMNRVYLAFPEWGFQTSYFVSVNDLVIEQSAVEIEALNMPKKGRKNWATRVFVQQLADIWRKAHGEWPTQTFDRAEKKWVGPFHDFVRLCCKLFNASGAGLEDEIKEALFHIGELAREARKRAEGAAASGTGK